MSMYNRVKTWASEVLFAADLNAEFDAVQDAVNSVGREQITPLAVDTGQLETGAVTTEKIDGGAVTTAKIDENAVTDSIHAHDDTEVDLVPDEWVELASQALQLATPAGAVLVGFHCVYQAGEESDSDDSFIDRVDTIEIHLKREGVIVDTWEMTADKAHGGNSRVFRPVKTFAFFYIDTEANPGTEPDYVVEAKSSYAFDALPTKVTAKALTIVEFRR